MTLNLNVKRGLKMPNREQVERITDRLYKDARNSGQRVTREAIRRDVVKQAKKQDLKNN